MATFILIIILHGGSYGGTGKAVTSIEFSDRSHCESAAQTVIERLGTRMMGGLAEVICVAK